MEFSELIISELKAFLRTRGKKCSGNRQELLRLCNLYKNEKVVDLRPSALEEDLNDQRRCFDDTNLEWKDVLGSKISVSTSFSIDKINTFLTKSLIMAGSNTINTDAGTLKPAKKGRMLYCSEKVQLCQVSSSMAGYLLFRCQMEASMKNKLRFTFVQLSKAGDIVLTRCDCEQNADGRCSHVACLLYLIEDLSLHVAPRIMTACTSKPMTWGKGSRKSKNPQALHSTNYSKRVKSDHVYSFDPRPPTTSSQSSTQGRFDRLLLSCNQSTTNRQWRDFICPTFEDYQLDDERKEVLQLMVQEFIRGQTEDLVKFNGDLLSNEYAVHLASTVSQSSSSEWKEARQYRITASSFATFKTCPLSWTCKRLWSKEKDLSSLPAVQWGLMNEENALKELEEHVGPLTRCGLFISKKFPFLGATPDSLLLKNGCLVVVEIKCPWVLREHKPTDLDKLTCQQRKNFFCILKNGQLQLKRRHRYYHQILHQMFVTGATKTIFCV